MVGYDPISNFDRLDQFDIYTAELVGVTYRVDCWRDQAGRLRLDDLAISQINVIGGGEGASLPIGEIVQLKIKFCSETNSRALLVHMGSKVIDQELAETWDRKYNRNKPKPLIFLEGIGEFKWGNGLYLLGDGSPKLKFCMQLSAEATDPSSLNLARTLLKDADNLSNKCREFACSELLELKNLF